MPIPLELDKTIEESRISIVVFSKSYASSIQCLDELVKIVKCKNTMGQIVFPIFYDVEPYEPRYQEGVFEEAFADHKERFEIEKVEMWVKTLKEVSNLSGFPLKGRYRAVLPLL
ncbi:disease resistance protein RML1B-like [Pistacia vera]|uniref:disease resistance protein RML1B-like n=1 Tax=Pistacia vera TaxID=55513 RepID=UPI001263952B|nr:disease resistance protein RML1B-like [Pistacia vera]